MNHLLVLASKSPRRQQLLQQLGYQFVCKNADVDESILLNERAENYVQRVATAKAQAINALLSKSIHQQVVLAADTSVVIDGEILGKPRDFDDCHRMLTLLSNSQHQVLTAISVVRKKKLREQLIRTDVTFKTLSDQEIIHYWQSGEPQDKAGSYGIQGIAGQFVKNIQGSYSAVVGLPLYETATLLAEFGVKTSLNDSQ